MDIFSAGCVIAEILMDGVQLFTLSQLKKLTLEKEDVRDDDTRKRLSERIKDQDAEMKELMVDLIMEMIKKEPTARPSINRCIETWNEKVLP